MNSRSSDRISERTLARVSVNIGNYYRRIFTHQRNTITKYKQILIQIKRQQKEEIHKRNKMQKNIKSVLREVKELRKLVEEMRNETKKE